MSVVQSTLAGEINPDIVRLVNTHGALATGVNGLDANLFVARQRDPALGFVGDVAEVNPALITSLQDQGYVPVVAPLARGEDGHSYNLNADTAAGALAAALGAAKLVYLTDVEGLYRHLGDEGSLISRSSVAGSKNFSTPDLYLTACFPSCARASMRCVAACRVRTSSMGGCSTRCFSRSSLPRA